MMEVINLAKPRPCPVIKVIFLQSMRQLALAQPFTLITLSEENIKLQKALKNCPKAHILCADAKFFLWL